MIGVNISTPKAPRLVIVNVPPCISPAGERSSRARATRSRDPADDLAEPSLARPGSPGRAGPRRCRRRSRCGLRRDTIAIAVPSGVQHRVIAQRDRGQLDDEVGIARGRSRPAWTAALNCGRRFTRFVASTVVVSVTAAVVWRLWTIRAAIVRRVGTDRRLPVFAAKQVRASPETASPAATCGGEDVGLADPARAAAAGEPRPVDAQLAGQPPAPAARSDGRFAERGASAWRGEMPLLRWLGRPHRGVRDGPAPGAPPRSKLDRRILPGARR